MFRRTSKHPVASVDMLAGMQTETPIDIPEASISAGARAAVKRRWLTLTTLCLAVLVAQIDTAVVNLATRPIGADLKVGIGALQWIVDSYNLVYAVLLLTGETCYRIYSTYCCWPVFRRRLWRFRPGLPAYPRDRSECSCMEGCRQGPCEQISCRRFRSARARTDTRRFERRPAVLA